MCIIGKNKSKAKKQCVWLQVTQIREFAMAATCDEQWLVKIFGVGLAEGEVYYE